MRSALEDGDEVRAEAALGRFSAHAERARSRSGGPLWRITEWTPWLGDNPKALRLAAVAADNIGTEAQRTFFDDGGSDLLDRLTPRKGAFNLAAVQELQPAMGRLAGVVQRDATALNEIAADDLIGPARKPYASLIDELNNVQRSILAANRAVQVVPAALGAERPQNYLLMFGTNAELRTYGGMPGSWALVRASKGKLSIIRQGNAGDFGPYVRPVTELTEQEEAIYGTYPAYFFQDVGAVPDFPRTAEFATAMWKSRYREKLDGVLQIDTVTLKYLLRATGSVEAPGGITLSEKNVLAELLNTTYLREPDTTKQNVFFDAVARRLFSKFTGGSESPLAMVTALSSSVREGRVHLNLAEPDLQRELDGSAIAGEFRTPPADKPELGLYLNDATASKMSYYLSYDLQTTAKSCRSGKQTLTSTATFRSKKVPQAAVDDDYISGAAKRGIPRGQQLVIFRVFGPTGGTLKDVRFDGKLIPVTELYDDDRPVVVSAVQVKSGQSQTVTWTTTTARGAEDDVRQVLTPGLDSRPFARMISSAC